MNILEFLRNKIFWGLDTIKGGGKLKCYNDIKFITENPELPKAIKQKETSLNNILKHASNSTKYYNKLKNITSIEEFPVLNKNIIKSNFDDFQSSDFIELTKFKFSTSGSTGTPFTIYQDEGKRMRSQMDTIFFSEKAGFKIGYKLTYFRIWKAFEKNGTLSNLMQNINPIDVFEMQNNIEHIISDLKSSNASNSWLGYASAFEEICKYLDKNKIVIPGKLKSIIAMSEHLSDFTKDSMFTYFGTEVVSRYSNVENGIIAQQPLGHKKYFEINDASYFVEVLELNSDKRVKDGEPGRIVITDLFNYCMPMIRYDTGDIGVKNSIDSKAVFTEISGRKVDVIFNTDGKAVNGKLVSLMVNTYPELNQCQLIQKEEGIYHLKINSLKEFDREKEFISGFKVYLGEDAKISVEYVREIPLLASGKRRVMVNEMIN